MPSVRIIFSNIAHLQCAHERQRRMFASAKTPVANRQTKYNRTPSQCCIKVWSPVDALLGGSLLQKNTALIRHSIDRADYLMQF